MQIYKVNSSLNSNKTEGLISSMFNEKDPNLSYTRSTKDILTRTTRKVSLLFRKTSDC